MSLSILSRRHFQLRRGRSALTMLGIAIGVATVFAVTSTIERTKASYRHMFQSMGGNSQIEVIAEAERGFDPKLAEELEGLAGVKAAVGIVQLPLAMRAGGMNYPMTALGVDPKREHLIREYKLLGERSLKSWQAKEGVLIDSELAAGAGIAVGDKITLITPKGRQEIAVRSLIQARGSQLQQVQALVMHIEDAQEVFGLGADVTTVQIVLQDAIDFAAIEPQIEALLGPGLYIQKPEERGALADSSLFATEKGLESLSAISLVAGAFVILNAFLMSIGERKRQLAILRSFGAKRSQVLNLFVKEALILSLVGTLIGLLLGFAAAWSLSRAMEALLLRELPPMSWDWAAFSKAIIVGPSLSLLATILPAWQASRRDPLDDLAFRREEPGQKGRPWLCYLGVAIVVFCVLLFPFILYTKWVPLEFITTAIALLMVGLVLALPLVLRPILRTCRPIASKIFGIEGQLASKQLGRRVERTTLTLGVLFIAVVASIATGNSLVNNLDDIDSWYRVAIADDFFVRTSFPDTALMSATPMNLGHAKKLAEIDGIAELTRVSFYPLRVKSMRATLIARDFRAHHGKEIDIVEGDTETTIKALMAGEIAIGSLLSKRFDLSPGDYLELNTNAGPKNFRIAATVTEYTSGGAALYMDWEIATKTFSFRDVHAFMMKKELDGPDPNEALRDYCGRHGLLLQSKKNLTQVIDSILEGITSFIWLLIAILYVLASLGIANTLTMNVVDQTRELGLLRSVGMKAGEIRKLIRAQAFVISLGAIIPGFIVGIILSWMQTKAFYPVVGHDIEFKLSAPILIVACLGAFLTTTLAAWFPAIRAGKLDVVDALHYE